MPVGHEGVDVGEDAPLVLRDVQGKSYDEIAAILATSEGTVKSRINRARNFLRDKMHDYL